MSKPTVLFVDDEERIVKTLSVLFKMQGKYNVLTATSAEQALELFNTNTVHVIVSDQRMPETTGVELLSTIREKSPNTIRILLTGYADLSAIVGSINDGEVYRYITKPWNNETLKTTVEQAMVAAQELFLSGSSAEQPSIAKAADLPSSHNDGIMVIHSEKDEVTKLVESLYSEYPVYSVTNPEQVAKVLGEKEVSVVVADIGENLDEIISTVKLIKHANPSAMTIVLSDGADANTAISLINQGQVYRYLPKPLQSGRLKLSISSALNYYKSCKSNPVQMKRHTVETITTQEGAPVDSSLSNRFSKLRAMFS